MFSKKHFRMVNPVINLLDFPDYSSIIFFINNYKLVEYKKSQITPFWSNINTISGVYELYKIKIIPALKILMLKGLQLRIGITNLHAEFLKYCKEKHLYFQALPIIEFPFEIKYLDISRIAQFFINGTDIFLELQMYEEALLFVYKGLSWCAFLNKESNSKRTFNSKLTIERSQLNNLTTKCILLELVLDKKKMRNIDQNLVNLDNGPQRKAIIDLVQIYRNNKCPSSEQVKKLKQFYLLDLFNRKSQRALKTDIQAKQGEGIWRFQIDTIELDQLGQFQTIKSINLTEKMYEFDSKNEIVYLHKRKGTQEQLNKIVTSTFIYLELLKPINILSQEEEAQINYRTMPNKNYLR